MSERMFVVLVAVLALVGLVSLAPGPVGRSTMTEDHPSWDCATMGNRVCGPTDSPVIYAP